MGLASSGRIGRWFGMGAGLVLLLATSTSFADGIDGLPSAKDAGSEALVETNTGDSLLDRLTSEFILSAGLRKDNLDWSIAGSPSGGTPNVLSELSWSNIDSLQLSLENRTHYKKHYYVRGALRYAWIDDGIVRDSDYAGDFRTVEWSRSISQNNGDEVWEAVAGGGYTFYFLQDRLQVSPLIGYAYHKQNLRITNGAQVISEDNPFSNDPADNPPAIGPLSNQLDSTYRARWMGPWMGCDVHYRLKDRFSRLPPIRMGFSMEFHWADYYGEGNWNLRGDLAHPKSFEHETRANGISVAGECLVALAAHWDLTLAVQIKEWSTIRGTDRKFLAQGGSVETRLNKVNWESTSIMVGAVYRF